MPLLGDPNHEHIVDSLRHRVPQLLRLGTSEAPRAIILVTAHWSEKRPTVSNGAKHRLLYDYNNFPPETYKLKYDAPGSPEVAQEVVKVLEAAGLKPETDDERGTTFIPMHIHKGDVALRLTTRSRLGPRRLRSYAHDQSLSRHANRATVCARQRVSC